MPITFDNNPRLFNCPFIFWLIFRHEICTYFIAIYSYKMPSSYKGLPRTGNSNRVI